MVRVYHEDETVLGYCVPGELAGQRTDGLHKSQVGLIVAHRLQGGRGVAHGQPDADAGVISSQCHEPPRKQELGSRQAGCQTERGVATLPQRVCPGGEPIAGREDRPGPLDDQPPGDCQL